MFGFMYVYLIVLIIGIGMLLYLMFLGIKLLRMEINKREMEIISKNTEE